MADCTHSNLELLPERKETLRCRHCHLSIAAASWATAIVRNVSIAAACAATILNSWLRPPTIARVTAAKIAALSLKCREPPH